MFAMLIWGVAGVVVAALFIWWQRRNPPTRGAVVERNLATMQVMVDEALVQLNGHLRPRLEAEYANVIRGSLEDPNRAYDFLMLCHGYAHGWLERYFEAKLWHLEKSKKVPTGIPERLTRVASITWYQALAGGPKARFFEEEPPWFTAARLLFDEDPLFAECYRRGYEGELDEFWDVTLSSWRLGVPLLPNSRSV